MASLVWIGQILAGLARHLSIESRSPSKQLTNQRIQPAWVVFVFIESKTIILYTGFKNGCF